MPKLNLVLPVLGFFVAPNHDISALQFVLFELSCELAIDDYKVRDVKYFAERHKHITDGDIVCELVQNARPLVASIGCFVTIFFVSHG